MGTNRSPGTKCPKSIIIGGGYSQGAAITHRTVEKLPQNIKDKIAGVVLYGDTQNKQDGGKIKNFPPDRVKVFCNGYGELKGKSSDGVCGGALMVNGGHLSYSESMKPGATFLKERVDALKGTKGSAPAEAPEAPAAPAAPAKASPAKASPAKSPAKASPVSSQI
jgi:cutinase